MSDCDEDEKLYEVGPFNGSVFVSSNIEVIPTGLYTRAEIAAWVVWHLAIAAQRHRQQLKLVAKTQGACAATALGEPE